MAKFEPVPLSEDPFKEEKFKFPLLKRIEDYAEEHDCSILVASRTVVPEYALELPWRDQELFDSAGAWQQEDIAKNSPHSLLRQIEDKPQGKAPNQDWNHADKAEGGKN